MINKQRLRVEVLRLGSEIAKAEKIHKKRRKKRMKKTERKITSSARESQDLALPRRAEPNALAERRAKTCGRRKKSKTTKVFETHADVTAELFCCFVRFHACNNARLWYPRLSRKPFEISDESMVVHLMARKSFDLTNISR